MAYCVHCGVKLGETEKKCPLCGTEVICPAEPPAVDAPKPFPVRAPEQTLTMNRKYAITLLSLFVLGPAALCLFLDLLGGVVSWSLYPVGVLVLIWIVFTVPLLMKRHRLNSTILITSAALAGYLYMVERLSNSPGWFFPIVLPSLILFTAMTCFSIGLIRKRHVHPLIAAMAILIQIAILTLAVELLCLWYGVGGGRLSWSPYVIAPFFFIALLMYVIKKNRPLYEELKRRLHF